MKQTRIFAAAYVILFACLDSAGAQNAGPWEKIPDLWQTWSHAVAVTDDQRIFIVGGLRIPDGRIEPLGSPAALWAYDLTTKKWTELPPMPTPRVGFAAGVIDGKIYVAGGVSPEGGNFRDWRQFDDLEVYDIKANRWAKKTPMPNPGPVVGAVVDGILYVITKFQLKTIGPSSRIGLPCGASMTAYDPQADSWTIKRFMPEGRCNATAVAADHRLYVVGGSNWPRRRADETEIKPTYTHVYDPKTDTWSLMPPWKFPAANPVVASFGSKLHGMDGPHGIFDIVTGSWTTRLPMRSDLFAASAVTVRDRIFVLMGTGNDRHVIWVDPKLTNPHPNRIGFAESYDPRRDPLSAESDFEQPDLAPAVASPAPVAEPDMAFARSNPSRPHDFALVVGVERYRALPPASFARRDAQAFRQFAQAALGIPEDNIITLTDEHAARTDIAKYVDEWLPRNVREDSRVYLFFAGHGAPEPSEGATYLVPWDGDPNFLKTTAMSLDRLYASLSELKAREVVVMLDASYSGEGGRSVLGKGLRPLVQLRSAAARGSKLTILKAVSGSEGAGSHETDRHGLFTYYLLRGLQGSADLNKNGHVTVGELHRYVHGNVLDKARRQNREQNPALEPPGKQLELY